MIKRERRKNTPNTTIKTNPLYIHPTKLLVIPVYMKERPNIVVEEIYWEVHMFPSPFLNY